MAAAHNHWGIDGLELSCWLQNNEAKVWHYGNLDRRRREAASGGDNIGLIYLEIDVEARLYRLAISLSILAAIGFGLAAIASHNRMNGYQQIMLLDGDMLKTMQKYCQEEMKDQELKFDCYTKADKVHIDSLTRDARSRNEAATRRDDFVAAAIGVPAGLFLLFFAGRWIITGKMRKPRVQPNGTQIEAGATHGDG